MQPDSNPLSSSSSQLTKVAIIGAGNVSTHLATGLKAAGVEVVWVYSRTERHAQELAQQVQSQAITNVDFTVAPLADIYLLSIPDQALDQLAREAVFPANVLVVHTSGAQPLQVLSSISGVRRGVFYPLQTFSKEKAVDWQTIPICVEAERPEDERILKELGKLLSNQVVILQGEARKKLHVAAVFACNFTNHLWGIAQELLQKAQLPTHLLEPLMQETLEKARQFPPFMVQTGPAQRNDKNTIQAHLQLLAGNPQYQQVYQTLTRSIQTTASENGLISGKQAKND
ncbi:Rossmann-like and DUF2520 domain-containing protein [Rufibacter sp. DG15C]|uniref:Rossmann-like and DUF2520 domain-containing protein n=1 Tax=Rufibacter sp. DG15C TaxID=1379909 RepID=UPI00082B648B|nr:Rossmann-like and DUF2520 domain-containing protein [Rufibacter sp. DG15C]